MHIGKVVCIQCSDCPLPWAIDSEKIWLKQPQAASALDFSYFQRVSKLVTHDNKKNRKTIVFSGFVVLFLLFAEYAKALQRFWHQRLTPTVSLTPNDTIFVGMPYRKNKLLIWGCFSILSQGQHPRLHTAGLCLCRSLSGIWKAERQCLYMIKKQTKNDSFPLFQQSKGVPQ